MIIINSIGTDFFELNSVRYSRIYEPKITSDYHISISNIYDVRNQLITSTHYGDFVVNGQTFNSRNELIVGLVPVIYDSVLAENGGEVDGLLVHINNYQNPHNVSKSQVGLSNVDNTSDADKPVSDATQILIDAHSGDTSIHFTKDSILFEELGSTGHTHSINDVTGLQVELDLKTDNTEFTSHTGDTTNPHNVTKSQVGLGNVDNTSDIDKPISNATQGALDLKSDILETGRKLSANQVNSTISLLDANGNVLDTLNVGFLNNEGTTLEYNSTNETIDIKNDAGTVLSSIPVSSFLTNIGSNLNLDGTALQLRDSANVILSSVTFNISNITGLQSTLNTKVDKVAGKQLSTNDYSTAEKNKLAGIASGAEVNVQSDWNATTGDAFIKNKPSTFTPSTHTHTVSEITGLQAELDLKTDNAEFTSHTGDTTNPHNVTKSQVGLGNVDNTSDADKPISTAAQAALNNKVDKISGKGLSTEDYSTTEKTKLAGIQAGAEVNINADWNATTGDAQILNKPSVFAPDAHTHPISDVTNLQSELDGKVDKVAGKQLSTNDYTSAEKTKLSGIQSGAEVNIQSDWNATSGDAFIKNKPSVFTPDAHTHTINDVTGLQIALNNKSNISETARKLQANQVNSTISLLDANDNILDTLNVGFLNNEGTTLEYNGTTETIDIKNDNNELLSSIPVSSFLTNIGSNLNLEGTSLQLRDSSNTVLSSVILSASNISGLQDLLDTKVDKVAGKQLSSNDFTSSLKLKLDGIASGAEVNIQSDWNATSGDAFIKNKPSVFTPDAHTHTINDVTGLQDDLDTKVDKVAGKQLSTNDYTNGEKVKLAGIQTGAQVNVQSDWNAINGDAFIKNKPSVFTPAAHTHSISNINGLQGELDSKVDKVVGKGLSSNDYTSTEKTKLSGIAAGAEVNVNADWNATSGDAQILNKPTIPSLNGYATESWVNAQVSNLIDTAPEALDTLNELAAALGDDPNFATTISNQLGNKVDKVTGKGLSTNDYSTAEKNKLSGIAAGAEVNVNADWNATTGDAKILNKPSVFTPAAHTHTVSEIIDLQDALDGKVDKVAGKQLSTNDYTNDEKNKLNGIQSGAEVNVNADWFATTGDALILNKPDTFPADPHTHSWLSITDKPATFPADPHTHSWSSITGKPSTFTPSTHTHSWSNITDKPSVFTPAAHTHIINDVTGLQDELDSKVDKVTGKQLSTEDYSTAEKNKLSGIASGAEVNVQSDWNATTGDAFIKNKPSVFPAEAHTHSWSSITGKPSVFTPDTHTHTVSEVTDLQDELDTKVDKVVGKGLSTNDYTGTDKSKLAGIQAGAEVNVQSDWNAISGDAFIKNKPSTFTPSAHSHSWSSITGKPSVFAPSAHSHPISEVTDLQDELDSKVDKVAGKGLSDENFSTVEKNKLSGIASGAEVNVQSDWNATTGDALILNKPATFPAAPHTHSWSSITGKPSTFTPSTHTHPISEVTDLQDELDSKVNKVTGKQLSTNDFTNSLKTKLNGIQAGAEVNVNADWNATTGDSLILNKPTIPSINGLASEDYVNAKISEIIDTAPEALDTLNELAAALGDDPNFATTITTELGNKVDKVAGKGLSDENYTSTEKTKLAGIAANAEVNVQSDWNAVSGDAFIKNKPSVFPAEAHTHIIGDVTGLQGELDGKVDKIAGKGLSTNDYTSSEKTKLAGIQAGAEINVQSDWNAISGDAFIKNKPSVFTPDAHTHPISDVTNLQNELDSKVDKVSGKGLSTNDFSTAEKNKLSGIASGAEVNVQSDWNATTGDAFIKNKPSTFTPSTHTHSWSSITGKPSTFTPSTHTHSWSSITGKPSVFAPASHTHSIDDVTGLQGELDGKVDKVAGKGLSTNDYTGAEKTKLAGIQSGAEVNVQSDWDAISGDALILNKPSVFPAEAHLHSIAEVTNLQSELDGKVDTVTGKGLSTEDFTSSEKTKLAGIASGAEVNVKSDWNATTGDAQILNKPSTFAPSAHSHSWSSITGKPSTFTPSSHTHSIGNVNGLQSALNLKSDITQTGAALSANTVNSTISILNSDGDVLDTLNVGFLNNEGTVLEYSASTESIVMKNDNGDILTSIPVSSFMTNIGNNLNLTSSTLQLRDSANVVLSNVTFNISNINGLQGELDDKVDKVTGKGLSTNDYTNTEKTKLSGIAAGAEVNVKSDWNATSGDAQILNKPSTFAPSAHSHSWSSITGKPSTFTPAAHTHIIDDVTGLQGELDGKVDKIAGKGLSTEDFTSTEKTKLSGIASGAEVNVQSDWNAVSGDAFIKNKPSTFTPSAHSHSWSSITGKPSVFPPDTHSHSWSSITGKPSVFNPSVHSHIIDDITGLQGELDGKVDKVNGKGLSSNDYTSTEKTKLAGIASGAEVNVQSDWNAISGDAFIKNKPATFPAEAHSHSWSSITGKPSTFTPSTHTHPISEVVDLQDVLNNKLNFNGDGSSLTKVIKEKLQIDSNGNFTSSTNGSIGFSSVSGTDYNGSLPTNYGLLYTFGGITNSRGFSFFKPNSSIDDFYIGLANSSGVQTYRKLLHSGSVIDADTLDGLDSSQFLRKDSMNTGLNTSIQFNTNYGVHFGTYYSRQTRIIKEGENTLLKLNEGSLLIQNGNNTKFTFEKNNGDLTASGSITASKLKINGGTSDQYLMADGTTTTAANSGGIQYLEKKFTLNNFQIRTLNSSPYTILQAPGVGKVYEIIKVTFKHIHNGTFNNASLVYIGDQKTAKFSQFGFGTKVYSFEEWSGNSLQENNPMVISALQDSTTGNGSATFYVTYRILEL